MTERKNGQKKTKRNPNAAGRPTKMDELTVKKLEEAFANGATDVQACFYAGITKQTLYNYQTEHPEFIDRKEGLKAQLGLISKNVLGRAIRDGDVNKAAWYLERKESDEYGNKNKNENENRYVDKHGNDLHSKDIELLKKLGIGERND